MLKAQSNLERASRDVIDRPYVVMAAPYFVVNGHFSLALTWISITTSLSNAASVENRFTRADSSTVPQRRHSARKKENPPFHRVHSEEVRAAISQNIVDVEVHSRRNSRLGPASTAKRACKKRARHPRLRDILPTRQIRLSLTRRLLARNSLPPPILNDSFSI